MNQTEQELAVSMDRHPLALFLRLMRFHAV
jgi:hypothetical protein